MKNNFKIFGTYSNYLKGALDYPNVSYIKDENKCYYKKFKVEEGCIAYWDGFKIDYVTESDWSSSLGIPVGIVVIPWIHREDGKTVIMSLSNMSLKTPETGSLSASAVSGDNYMMWGDYQKDLSLTNYTKVPCIDPQTEDSSVALNGYGYLPSDMYESGFSVDGISKYPGTYSGGGDYDDYDEGGSGSGEFNIDHEGYLISSPYNLDGTKNSNYSYPGTALYDMSGKSNQSVIMSAVTADISGTISNSSNTGNYPAASCCSRYHTTGTSAGDWYLPSMGELGYLQVRLSTINNSLSTLGSGYAVKVGDKNTSSSLGSWLWSSTEYSSNNAWYLNTINGNCNNGYKSSLSTNNRVRAFCAL